MKKGFSLIEIIFTIVIIGIFLAISLPKFDAFLKEASLDELRSELLHIQNLILKAKQNNILQAKAANPSDLNKDDNIFGALSDERFENWTLQKKSNNKIYYLRLFENEKITFIYDFHDGSFTCNKPKNICELL